MSAAAEELAAELGGEQPEAPEGEHEHDEHEHEHEQTDEGFEAPELDERDEGAEAELAGEFEASGEAEPSTKQLRALDAEQRRHFGRLGTIMGGFVSGFEECEHCAGMGLVPPGPKPQTHEYFRACATCAGYGEVLTGSRRDGQVSRDCPACGGRGYVEALDENGMPLAGGAQRAGEPGSAQTPTTPAADGAAGAPSSSGDRFGMPSWMGDPSLGQH